jgi:serine/threonine protein kinase
MKTPHKKKGAKTPATPRRRSFCGTIDYMAPELLRGEPYDDGVDWWALGCVFHELLSDKPPFSRDRPRDMFCAILREEPPSLIMKCGVECNDAVQGLLKKSSSERFGSDSLRSHAFFGDVDWSAMERKEVAPPHAPVLKPYLAETPAGVKCVESGRLPRLNDDGESSDEDDSSSRRVVQDAFRGFAYAGDD